MAHDVITTAPDVFIEDAARLMVGNKIGGLPVVDEENQVVGVITETDVFRAFIEQGWPLGPMPGPEGARQKGVDGRAVESGSRTGG